MHEWEWTAADSYGNVQAAICLKAFRTTALHNEQDILCGELQRVESTCLHPTKLVKIMQSIIIVEKLEGCTWTSVTC